MNNGYEAAGFAENHYAARAHADLIVTKGKGFTKEKNKKKRGSYRGGAIDFETKSYKFKD
ncbi:SRP40, C-terminal domain-containing protein [Pyronema omphalodes]|nr:SRP40, C-terminal domain-containing protein [Pyronema omphalodes]